MASNAGVAQFNNLYVSTMDKYADGMYDNIRSKLPLFSLLTQHNIRLKSEPTGSFFSANIKYATPSANVKGLGRFGTLAPVPVEMYTYATYPYKRIVGSVVNEDWDQQINGGQEAIFNLIDTLKQDGQNELLTKVEACLVQASAGTDEPSSLLEIVDSTGTVGGLAQSSYSWWAATETSVGSFSSAGISTLQATINNLSTLKSSGKTDLIVMSATDLGYLQAAYRAYYSGNDMPSIDLGFKQPDGESLQASAFAGIPCVISPNLSAGTALLLNRSTIGWHGDKKVRATEPVRPVNQLATYFHYTLMGNLFTVERRANAKLTGITA